MQKQTKDLPSPDKYVVGLNLLDKTKRFPLYKTDRKTYCDTIKKNSKLTPGVGAYETKGLPEKIKGNFKCTLDRCSIVDEAKAMSLLVPGAYPAIELEKIKAKSNAWKIRPETEKEKEQEKEKVRRKDHPSPFSYKKEESYQKSQVCENSFVISKTKTKKFTDYVSSKKKFVPGVGHYSIAKPLDYISKPMRKY